MCVNKSRVVIGPRTRFSKPDRSRTGAPGYEDSRPPRQGFGWRASGHRVAIRSSLMCCPPEGNLLGRPRRRGVQAVLEDLGRRPDLGSGLDGARPLAQGGALRLATKEVTTPRPASSRGGKPIGRLQGRSSFHSSRHGGSRFEARTRSLVYTSRSVAEGRAARDTRLVRGSRRHDGELLTPGREALRTAVPVETNALPDPRRVRVFQMEESGGFSRASTATRRFSDRPRGTYARSDGRAWCGFGAAFLGPFPSSADRGQTKAASGSRPRWLQLGGCPAPFPPP